MANTELTIFLASPLEFSTERVLIGSRVGLLNTHYHSLGKYIALNKWEDFSCSYVGIRTQSAYNDELLSPADILIVLFYSGTGHFTKEECEMAVSQGKRIITAIKVDNNPDYEIPADVSEFNDRLKVCSTYEDSWRFSTSEELITKIENLIERELGECPESVKGVDDHFSCYMAHTPMLNFGAEELRDRIRATDLRTRAYGNRIFMLPSKQTAMIPLSKYNVCLYLENPDDSMYQETELMYSCSESEGTPMLRCKFHEPGEYKEIPFDNINPRDFGKTIPVSKCSDGIIRLGGLCDGVIKEIEQHQSRHSANSRKLHYDIISGKFTLHGVEVEPDESVVSLMDPLKFRQYNAAEQRLESLKEEDKASRKYLAAVKEAGKLQKMLSETYSSLIQLSNLLDEIPVNWDSISEKFRTLWNDGKYDELISEISFSEVSLKDKKRFKYRFSFPELFEKLMLCTLKLKALFKSPNGNRRVLIPALIDSRLEIAKRLYMTEKEFSTEVVLSYLMLAIFHQTDQNFIRQSRLPEFFRFIDKNDLDSVLADCEFRFQYADYLIENGDYNKANKHLETGFRKLTSNYKERGIFDYKLGITIFRMIERYLELRMFIDDLTRWIGYWEIALEATKDDSAVWKLGYLMMTAAKMRTLDPNCNDDDKRGLEINIEASRIFRTLLNVYHNLDNDLRLDVVYVANILGIFYTDRYDGSERTSTYLRQAFYFLNVAEDILIQVRDEDFRESLPFLGQTFHNLGRTYDTNHDTRSALKYYEYAYQYRGWLNEICHDCQSAQLLAETATNLGGILRDIDPRRALSFAKEAENLYAGTCNRQQTESVTNFMKARQLRGTILYDNPATKEEGLELLAEVWSWAKEHPESTYFRMFVIHSCINLVRENRIPFVLEDGVYRVSLKENGYIEFKPEQNNRLW